MTHRLHKHALLLPLLALVACGSNPDTQGESASPPDIVLYLIDTLRADRVGPGGANDHLTPYMNMLAREGVVFEQAHSAGPWTLPSVVSLFTGRHIAEHNVIQERFQLTGAIPIIPQLLVDRGYAGFSYHRNPFAGKTYGLDAGFQVCEQIGGGVAVAKVIEPMFDQLDDGPGDQPYFLYLHTAEPHDPDASATAWRKMVDPVSKEFLTEYRSLVMAYRKMTRIDFSRKDPLGTTDNTELQRAKMQRLTELVDQVEVIYAGSVGVADMRMGKVIEKIKKRGRWDNTVFIVVSDHGEEMNDHGGWQHDQSVYQELLHVPLIIRFPGGEHGGRRVSTPVSLVDILPTLLEVAGASAEGTRLSGRSLMPLARGEAAPDEPRLVGMRHNERKFYAPYKEQRGDLNLAVRQGKWKAIYNIEPDTFELYDIESDPYELRNLAATEDELAAELKRFAIESYATLVQDSERARAGGLEDADQMTLKALEDLGYIGDGEEDEEE